MSGILIGVAAVIILIAAGNGASAAIKNSISALGSNTLTVTSNSTAAGRRVGGGAAGRGRGLGGGFGGAFGGGARPAAGRRCRGGRRRACRRWRAAARRAAAGAAGGTVDNGTQVRSPALTMDDAQALLDPVQAPDVVSVAPVVNATSVTATYAGASHTVGTFNGDHPELPGERQRHGRRRGRRSPSPTTTSAAGWRWSG